MEMNQKLNFNNAIVMSTEEFLARERKEIISSLVNKLMAKGKASNRHGWSMTEILSEIEIQLGTAALPYARRYIVQDVCGIK